LDESKYIRITGIDKENQKIDRIQSRAEVLKEIARLEAKLLRDK
jgi:hypothetical protein